MAPLRIDFLITTLIVVVTPGIGVHGLLAARVRDKVVSRPKIVAWMRRSFAFAFVGLAAKLAVAERS
jgi:threonine/homoserine/homoserine lactone efflux protein